MRVQGKVVVITGAAHGIGAALARRFAAAGAAGILVADLDGEAARDLAEELQRSGCHAIATRTDVGVEAEVAAMVATAQEQLGPIDLLCSNAGRIFGRGLDATADEWASAWSVNLMAHVHAARAVVPSMRERGFGYLLNTCSAAGLLAQPGDALYTATKHAAVGFAEWLALTYGDDGIRVSALCPQGVRTDMLAGGLEAGNHGAKVVAASGGVLEPEQVAETVVEGLDAERFLILPHPEVTKYEQRKTGDRDRWLAGMRKMMRST